MPTRPSVNMLCQISGRPAIQLKLWNCLKRCIDNSLWYETFKLWWSCKKILPRKSCCLGREQSDNSSSTDSPNWPTNDAWHITGPGAWGETDAFQKPTSASRLQSTVLFMFLEGTSQESIFTETYFDMVSPCCNDSYKGRCRPLIPSEYLLASWWLLRMNRLWGDRSLAQAEWGRGRRYC